MILATILLRFTLAMLFVFLVSHAAPLSSISRFDKGKDHVWKFLSKFGYVQAMLSIQKDILVSNDDGLLWAAIREFQRFNGLKVTGALDKETREKMDMPRCGLPDVSESHAIATDNNVQLPMTYYIYGARWIKPIVTWKLSNISTKLQENDQLLAFENALALWQREIPKRFQPTSGAADIEMSFGVGDHGDGIATSFDGKGHVLAHAYRPGAGMGGDAHFDDDEDWSVNGTGTDLLTVAAHELGHSLGLGHSDVPTAVMAPYYAFRGTVKLDRDDVRGIQALYGRPGTQLSRTSPKFVTFRTTEKDLQVRTSEATVKTDELVETIHEQISTNGINTNTATKLIQYLTYQVLVIQMGTHLWWMF